MPLSRKGGTSRELSMRARCRIVLGFAYLAAAPGIVAIVEVGVPEWAFITMFGSFWFSGCLFVVAMIGEPHKKGKMRSDPGMVKPEPEARQIYLRALSEIKRLEAENERLREAIASALTSLATGPMKDGYAYAVLESASSSNEKQT